MRKAKGVKPKMMPGEEPYTEGELEVVQRLMESACAAEERFDLDELERFAARKEGT